MFEYEIINSVYVGKIFRGICMGRSSGAYLVHQALKRKLNKSQFFVMQNIQNKRFENWSARTLRYAIKRKDLMYGYTWFSCTRCRGAGTFLYEYKNYACPHCESRGILWVDCGYTYLDVCDISQRRQVGAKKRANFSAEEFLYDMPLPAEFSNSSKPKKSSETILRDGIQGSSETKREQIICQSVDTGTPSQEIRGWTI